MLKCSLSVLVMLIPKLNPNWTYSFFCNMVASHPHLGCLQRLVHVHISPLLILPIQSDLFWPPPSLRIKSVHILTSTSSNLPLLVWPISVSLPRGMVKIYSRCTRDWWEWPRSLSSLETRPQSVDFHCSRPSKPFPWLNPSNRPKTPSRPRKIRLEDNQRVSSVQSWRAKKTDRW